LKTQAGEKAFRQSEKVNLNTRVGASSDLAAKRHGDDHAKDDDDGGGDTDSANTELVLIQRFVELRHDCIGAFLGVSVVTDCALSATRDSRIGWCLGGNRGSCRGGCFGCRRFGCRRLGYRRRGRLTSWIAGSWRVSDARIRLAAFEICLNFVEWIVGVGGVVGLLQLAEAFVDDFPEDGLIAAGQNGASDHQAKDEEEADGEQRQETLILLHGAATAQEADQHDANADDDQQHRRLLQRVRV